MISTLLRLMDCKPFRGRTGPEDRLAIDVATYLRAATLEGRLRGTWTHIPHEVGGGNGVASKIRYGLAKAMGLIAGSGDYVFVGPGVGGWIELKTETGRLNPAQKDFSEWCGDKSVNYAVCRSLSEVIEKLNAWGLLLAA